MTDIDVFAIDDDFDPLAETGFEADDDFDPNEEYIAPIPDVDKSVVPPAVILPPEERIAQLIKGIPGQTFRIIHGIELCAGEARLAEDIAADLERDFPQRISVYDAMQVLKLLERAGALERMEMEPEAGAEVDDIAAEAEVEATAIAAANVEALKDMEAFDNEDDLDEFAGEYLTPTPAPPVWYQATEAGLDAITKYASEQTIVNVIAEEPKYLPIYHQVLSMLAEEDGQSMKDLDAAVNADPLLVEPKRFCGYFLDRLDRSGAAEFKASRWRITPRGASVLAHYDFAC